MPKGARKYGHISGVAVGTSFRYRKTLLEAGVHGHLRGGIHAVSGSERGAFSICLSGRYEDDKDSGDKIVYVGVGGRSKDGIQDSGQSFDDYRNGSLRNSCKTKSPVRVSRRADKHNPYAPSSGYRYDGLYVVDSYTMKPGKAGFDMCFFDLSKIPEEGDNTEPSRSGENEGRKEVGDITEPSLSGENQEAAE